MEGTDGPSDSGSLPDLLRERLPWQPPLQQTPEMSLQLIPEEPAEWDAFLEETETPALAFSWWALFSCQTLHERVRAVPSSEPSREWGICQLGMLLTLSQPSQHIPHSTNTSGVENLRPHHPPKGQRQHFLSRGARETKH